VAELAGLPAPQRNSSTSLRRALRILDALVEPTATRRPLSLAELSADAELNKATALRLLAPLCDNALVAKTADGRYLLGVHAATLGEAYLAGLDLRAVAGPVLEELVARTGETAHLVVFAEPDVVYVHKVDSPSAVRMHSRVGARMPAYCTGVGKAMLAHLPAAVVDRVVAHGLPARTQRTLTDRAALEADLVRTRARGWAMDDVENEPEIRCVAAPIFDRSGTVAAACSLSGPLTRISRPRAKQLGPLIAVAAAEISRQLGAPATTEGAR
jgi:DNA-binding IclR family transcriptional regulator